MILAYGYVGLESQNCHESIISYQLEFSQACSSASVTNVINLPTGNITLDFTTNGNGAIRFVFGMSALILKKPISESFSIFFNCIQSPPFTPSEFVLIQVILKCHRRSRLSNAKSSKDGLIGWKLTN